MASLSVEIIDYECLEIFHANIIIRAVLEQQSTYLSIDYSSNNVFGATQNLPEFADVCLAGKNNPT